MVGIYTLANDIVCDWLVALLESVRHHEPDLPITVIPYDARLDRVEALRERYAFDILAEDDLARVDALAGRLWPSGMPLLRKLAALDGRYDSFLFLDADIIVLEPLRRFFEVHSPGRVHYFLENRQEVYEPGPFRARMVADHAARGINTGAWGGLRGVLSWADIERAGAEADELRGDSFFVAGEQTFLNYAIELSPAASVAYSDAIPGVGHSWAGARFARTPGGLVERLTATQRATGTAPMLHWAGYELSPTMPFFDLWTRERYRSSSPSLVRRRLLRARGELALSRSRVAAGAARRRLRGASR